MAIKHMPVDAEGQPLEADLDGLWEKIFMEDIGDLDSLVWVKIGERVAGITNLQYLKNIEKEYFEVQYIQPALLNAMKRAK